MMRAVCTFKTRVNALLHAGAWLRAPPATRTLASRRSTVAISDPGPTWTVFVHCGSCDAHAARASPPRRAWISRGPPAAWSPTMSAGLPQPAPP